MLSWGSFGKEEECVRPRPVGGEDDLPRHEESIDEEREVEGFCLGVEVVLADIDGEGVRAAEERAREEIRRRPVAEGDEGHLARNFSVRRDLDPQQPRRVVGTDGSGEQCRQQ